MDINDFFRGFFGFHRMDRNRPFREWNDDFNPDGEVKEPDPFIDGPIGHSLFDELEDMFNNMMTIQTGFMDMPNFEVSEDISNPRDMMLKSESCANCQHCPNPTNKFLHQVHIDDHDETGASGDATFGPSDKTFLKEPQQSVAFRQSQTRLVQSSDGVVEQKWSTKDSYGNTSTTVYKSIGDQSYKVTTQTDKNGLLEKTEDLVNLDERDVQEFQQRFQRLRNSPVEAISHPNIIGAMANPENESELAIKSPPGDPKFTSIFRRFFGVS